MLYQILKRLKLNYCLVCQLRCNNSLPICQSCFHDLNKVGYSCQRCAVTLTNSHSNYCAHCLRQPPLFDHIEYLFRYNDTVRRLIKDLKFKHKLEIAPLLAHLFAQKVKQSVYYTSNTPPEAIIPVPLHRSRIQQRGYNQAYEIGRIIARILKIPIWPRACKRIKATEPQSNLSAKQRQSNVKNAFAIKRLPQLRNITLIDDVVTTMNTVSELCKILKQSGVQRVDVWCIARGK